MTAALILRLFLAYVFIRHGYPKLFKDFEGTKKLVEGLGFKPASLFAFLLGISELGGGILLLLGIYVEYVSLLLFAVMLVALYAKVKWKKSAEYVVGILAMLLALFFLGAGSYSIGLLL